MAVLAAISVMGARRLTVSASTMVSIDGIAYNYNDGADICGIMADDTSIKVARLQADVFDGLEVRTFDYILAYGFHNCSSLEEVYLSDISYTIDRGAFFGCSSLKNVYFEGNNRIIFMDNSFSGCSRDLILWHNGNSSVVEFAAAYNYTACQKGFVVDITQQPASQDVAEGDDTSFEVAASAKSGGTISYQWEVSKNDGSNWESISGATSAKYAISGAEKGQSGWKYRCAVTERGYGTGYSEAATLTVKEKETETTDPSAPEEPSEYHITEGEDASWTKGGEDGLILKGDGDYEKFTGVKVDGIMLDESSYEAIPGSTVVILKAEYLNTLSGGSHTVTLVWENGTAETTIAIAANNTDNNGDGNNSDSNSGNGGNENGNSSNSSNGSNSGGSTATATATGKKDDVPKTGEEMPAMVLPVLMLISGVGIAAFGKKRKVSVR